MVMGVCIGGAYKYEIMEPVYSIQLATIKGKIH